MCSYGQRSMCADLLNSHLSFSVQKSVYHHPFLISTQKPKENPIVFNCKPFSFFWLTIVFLYDIPLTDIKITGIQDT